MGIVHLLFLLPVSSSSSSCAVGFENVSGTCLYKCNSDLALGTVVLNDKKGLALDDTTYSNCVDELPYKWPNTDIPVRSLRLFAAWKTYWDPSKRISSWKALIKWVRANNAKVLVGTQVSCDPAADVVDWDWVKEFLTMLGPASVMGLAIGNELELLQFKGSKYVTPGCMDALWKNGGYVATTKARIRELDQLPGFNTSSPPLPVTAVFGGLALGGNPFHESPHALINTYLTDIWAAYGARFRFTFNFYPYFATGLVPDFPPLCHEYECDRVVKHSVSYGVGGNLEQSVSATAAKVRQFTGDPNAKLWLGEIGWSALRSDTLSGLMVDCAQFSAYSTLLKYYERFLSWDLTFTAGAIPMVEHAFYFTVRDSNNFGVEEHFGLIATCGSTVCKLNSTSHLLKGGTCTSTQKALYTTFYVMFSILCCCWTCACVASLYYCCKKPKERRLVEENLIDNIEDDDDAE